MVSTIKLPKVISQSRATETRAATVIATDATVPPVPVITKIAPFRHRDTVPADTATIARERMVWITMMAAKDTATIINTESAHKKGAIIIVIATITVTEKTRTP